MILFLASDSVENKTLKIIKSNVLAYSDLACDGFFVSNHRLTIPL